MVRIEYREGPFAPHAGGAPPASNEAAQAAHQLVAAGAIMTLPEPRLERHLVGHLEWIDARRLFWFTAYGETLEDGHLLDFDSLRAVEGRGVYFSAGGDVIAHLSGIEQAGVEDPDDYRIAWQLWQEVVPLRRRLIDSYCNALVRGEALEGIDGFQRPRSTTVVPAVPGLRSARR